MEVMYQNAWLSGATPPDIARQPRCRNQIDDDGAATKGSPPYWRWNRRASSAQNVQNQPLHVAARNARSRATDVERSIYQGRHQVRDFFGGWLICRSPVSGLSVLAGQVYLLPSALHGKRAQADKPPRRW